MPAFALCPLLRACRVALNHSTNCDGLIPALQLVAKRSELIHSIVPGRIRTASGSTSGLQLRVSVRTPSGYKLIARKGSQVQEVFITTPAHVDSAAVSRELSTILPGVMLPTE